MLVRSTDKANKLRDLDYGISIVEGTPADAGLLHDLTKDADYIIDAVRLTRRGFLAQSLCIISITATT